MKLQRASRLALYAVLDLAADPRRQLSAAHIAEKYGVSINHLAKVLRDLGRAGLVESVRGAGGGFRFSANPRRTTIMDVIALFEPVGRGPARGAEPGAATAAGHALGRVLAEVDTIAEGTFRSITLATMLKLMAREG